MSAIVSALTALGISHTVVFFHAICYEPRIPTKNKFFLILCCLSHMIGRIQLLYLFDVDAPRNCSAMVVTCNLIGLVTFRFSLLYMLGQLSLTLNQYHIVAKACWVTGMLCWLASSIILMYQEISTPFFEPHSCLQDLLPSLSSANNALHLFAFVFLAAPTIFRLYMHIQHSKGSNVRNDTVRRVYLLQMSFMAAFMFVYLFLVISTWFLKDLYSMMYVFILSDYAWLNGINLWLLPQTPSGGSSSEEASVMSKMPQTTTVHMRQSMQPAARRISQAVKETSEADDV